MPKIDLNRLKTIIREEMKTLSEGADHDSATKQASVAAKLLNAVETFKEAASEKAKGDFGDSLAAVEQILTRIINSPMQYLDVPKAVVKKVSLKQVKTLGERSEHEMYSCKNCGHSKNDHDTTKGSDIGQSKKDICSGGKPGSQCKCNNCSIVGRESNNPRPYS